VPVLLCNAASDRGTRVSAANPVAIATTGFGQDSAGSESVRRVEKGLLPGVLIKGRSNAMTLADRMEHHRVVGVSIAVIHNGRIEWARAYGLIESEGNERITPQTLFQAGSISKPVAAMAALHLVEQGKLDLDEDVNRRLVSWKVPDNELTKEKKVTLRGLLSHSAGLTVHGFPGYAAEEQVPTLVHVLDGVRPANTAPIRVDLIPGSRWRYSGGGYTVMQQLLMDVTEKPFPLLMRELVLDRIGMKHSTYEQPLPEAIAASAATAHRNGRKIAGRYNTYPEMAAAGLWTTPSDLALWLIDVQRSIAGESNKVISTEMANQMVSRQSQDYGLGVALQGTHGTGRFGHGGVNEGFEASMTAYINAGMGAVVMTNSTRGAALAQEIVRSIAKEYAWPNFLPEERVIAQVDPKIYDTYVGQYEFGGMILTVSSEDGRLFGQPTGQSKEELYPESETKFFLSVPGDPHVSFVKDDDGRVIELILHQRGNQIKGKRIKPN
jgi:CubicO group peptidase (beta-lactamase class C family)